MKHYIFFAVVAFTAVVCCSAKPRYVGPYVSYSRLPMYGSGYNVPLVSASAAASSALSIARPAYVYHVPSYILDGGYYGRAEYSPSYGGSSYGLY